MLGHTPLSSAPLSSFSGGSEVLALISPTIAVISTNNPVVNGVSNVGVNSVISTVFITQPSYTASASVDTGSISISAILGSFDALIARANITLNGLDETSTIGSLLVSGSAGVRVSQVFATLRYPNVTIEGAANVDTTGVLSTMDVSDVASIGTAETSVMGVSSFFADLSNLEANGFVFNYTPYKDSYSRNRTVYTLSYPGDSTIHIIPENNVVSILPQDSNTTVYILT